MKSRLRLTRMGTPPPFSSFPSGKFLNVKVPPNYFDSLKSLFSATVGANLRQHHGTYKNLEPDAEHPQTLS